MDVNISDLFEDYKRLLSCQAPRLFKALISREKRNPDGAKFEAACFSIMRSLDLQIQFGEKSGTGGADFICAGKSGKFVLEATTINTLAMENHTHLKNDQSGIEGGNYRSYPNLYQKLVDKVKQLSQYQLPCIVAIGSLHSESLTLFRDVMADEYLDVFFMDDQYIEITENLKNISAVLLIGFGYYEYSIMGFLNPTPSYLFDIQLLPDIAFRKITEKGIKEKTGEGEWVKYNNNCIDPALRYPLERINQN